MSLILFMVLFFILWLLIEIMSILLKITGLDLHKARFQIISILTHTGFTTRESELIVQNPIRRRIASILMIVSYVSQVSLITLLFDVLYSNEKGLMDLFIVLAVVFVFIIAVTKSKFISGWIDNLMEKKLFKKIKKKAGCDYIDRILNLSPDFNIYELVIDSDSPMCGKTLREARLKDSFIQVLKIDRGSEVLDFPLADTMMHEGDRMIIYGRIDAITKMILKKEAAVV